jgi:hypothetical protein
VPLTGTPVDALADANQSIAGVPSRLSWDTSGSTSSVNALGLTARIRAATVQTTGGEIGSLCWAN